MLSTLVALTAVSAVAIAADTKPVCVADRTKSNSTLGAGLSYACSRGGDNCTDINAGGKYYYPNNIYAHCDRAFEQYYEAHKAGGAASCDFGGAAYLTNCSTLCTKCAAKPQASTAALQDSLAFLCAKGKGVLGDRCAAIQPNGSHYLPNTLPSHFDWAANVYYQTYRCTNGAAACNFGGSAEIVKC